MLEYLVSWKGYGPEFDEWYPRPLLMQNAAQLVEEFYKSHRLSLDELKLAKDSDSTGEPTPATQDNDAPTVVLPEGQQADWKVAHVVKRGRGRPRKVRQIE